MTYIRNLLSPPTNYRPGSPELLDVLAMLIQVALLPVEFTCRLFLDDFDLYLFLDQLLLPQTMNLEAY